jgi:hypothetical protein
LVTVGLNGVGFPAGLAVPGTIVGLADGLSEGRVGLVMVGLLVPGLTGFDNGIFAGIIGTGGFH